MKKLNMKQKETIRKLDTTLTKVKEWLENNIEEQSLPFELRQDSARLRDRIDEWEKEESNTTFIDINNTGGKW